MDFHQPWYVVDIWLGIANEQILSIFDGVICPPYVGILVSEW